MIFLVMLIGELAGLWWLPWWAYLIALMAESQHDR